MSVLRVKTCCGLPLEFGSIFIFWLLILVEISILVTIRDRGRNQHEIFADVGQAVLTIIVCGIGLYGVHKEEADYLLFPLIYFVISTFAILTLIFLMMVLLPVYLSLVPNELMQQFINTFPTLALPPLALMIIAVIQTYVVIVIHSYHAELKEKCRRNTVTNRELPRRRASDPPSYSQVELDIEMACFSTPPPPYSP